VSAPTFSDQIAETLQLVRLRKRDIAAQLKNSVEVPARELSSLLVLEVRLGNLANFQRLQELTRDAREPVVEA
jgi:hypothetical protein